MPLSLLQIITSPDAAIRNQSLDALCRRASAAELLAAATELDDFRQRSENLYERVRATLFLYAIHRFHLPDRLPVSAQPGQGHIPIRGFQLKLERSIE